LGGYIEPFGIGKTLSSRLPEMYHITTFLSPCGRLAADLGNLDTGVAHARRLPADDFEQRRDFRGVADQFRHSLDW
jgi:hypothetical protein